MSYEEDVNSRSQSKSADELLAELRELIIVCRKNPHYAQELQKQAYNKGVKLRGYALGEKIWLNSKYIKTKRNRKLEAKFFGPFRVLHPVEKQTYMSKLPKKWKIHDIFYVSLLEQDITRKRRVDDENATELDTDNSEKYKVEAIWDNAVYVRESESGHLQGFYYLVSWKEYAKEENTWEPVSAVQHLRKLISLIYQDHPEKLAATSPIVNTIPPMARLITRPTEPLKKKPGQSTGYAKKRANRGDKKKVTRRNLSQFGFQ